MSENIPAVAPSAGAPSASSVPTGSTEKVVWWVVFGVLILGVIGMLGAWN